MVQDPWKAHLKVVNEVYSSKLNNEIIYGCTSLDFYDKLEKRQNEILSQGKKVATLNFRSSISS